MEVNIVEQTDALSHVALAGRVDIAGVQEKQADFTAATADRGKPTIVDLAGVTFLASIGIRMLIAATKALKANGVRLVILAPSPQVADTLKAAGLDQVLGMVETKDEALKQLQDE